MKTTTIIPLFLILFMLGLLNSQAQFTQKPVRTITTKPFQERVTQYLSAKQIYYKSTIEKISKLEKRKATLLAELEKEKLQKPKKKESFPSLKPLPKNQRIPLNNPKLKGRMKLSPKTSNNQAILELENVQKELETYYKAEDYFLKIKPPKLPDPLPPPPVPCIVEDNNCIPIMTNIKGIKIENNTLRILEIEIIDTKNNVIGRKGSNAIKGKYGQIVNLKMKNFKGKAIMRTTLVIDGGIEITLETPVYGDK